MTRTVETGFFWPVRVYYEDTDAGGVVYYANYLKFFERARTERLRALGFEQDAIRSDFGLVFAVRSVQADYLKPARFNDALEVTAAMKDLRRASVTFDQAIHRGGEILCTAQVRIVCLSVDGFRPAAIPDHLLERIKHVV
ncbi:MAG: tol-pal system-associated acyl-CoA thioesterase [Methylococcaceae bacterium]|nr:tol-pal system-associated acyl-CoA thioesterase [Methylococcaceae bacterium]